MFPQRPPRLLPQAYTDTSAIFTVAFGTDQRVRVFARADVAAAMAATIREHADATGTVVYAYCVMPDHVQLLLSPSPTHSVNTFIGQVKNLGQRKAWSLGVRGAFWQRSFWDHCLRGSECLQQKIDDILDNPVRAGLTTDRERYPFSGVDARPSWSRGSSPAFSGQLDESCRGLSPATSPVEPGLAPGVPDRSIGSGTAVR